MRRQISLGLGIIALLTTGAVIGTHVVLAIHLPEESSGRTTSKVSAVLEAFVFTAIVWLLATYVSYSLNKVSMRCRGVVFGLSLFVIAFAATASVATMIYLSHLTLNLKDKIMGTNQSDFLLGSSIALGVSVAFQLLFVVTNFALTRKPDGGAFSLHHLGDDRRSPLFRPKCVTYSPTASELTQQTRGMTSIDSRSPPASVEGRPRTETVTAIKASLSNVIRPMTSKTQLLSARDKRRPASLDSAAYRPSAEDSFDSWDTSSVDTHNRQAVLEATSPPHGKSRFLETIPGSPTVVREGTPSVEVVSPLGIQMPAEPPRIRARSRSYSCVPVPVPDIHEPKLFTQQPSMSELHIHPLFRSDSPTPPPMATPGTVVIASPIAGQIITHRQSLRTFSSMRSVGPSPLSNRSSMESRRLRDDQSSLEEVAEERPITPPIPDWILTAGTRASWTGYNSRKGKGKSEGEGESEGEMEREPELEQKRRLA